MTEAIEFKIWCDANETNINFREEHTHSAEELYKIFKREKTESIMDSTSTLYRFERKDIGSCHIGSMDWYNSLTEKQKELYTVEKTYFSANPIIQGNTTTFK